MAAADLARGRAVMNVDCKDEVTLFLLMKEFGGTPSEWCSQDSKLIRAITLMLSTYNSVSNAEMEKKTKGGSKASGGPALGQKYRREERTGPNGTEIIDIPI